MLPSLILPPDKVVRASRVAVAVLYFFSMKSLLFCAFFVFSGLSVIRAGDATFPLKDIGPTVDAILGDEKFDESELAYIGARGAALFVAISKWLDENPGDERDKELSIKLMERAHPFFAIAHLFGARTGKSEANIDAQISSLLEIYVREMARSKQLNNETLSAPISRDMKALERVAPLINELVRAVEKSRVASPENSTPKP